MRTPLRTSVSPLLFSLLLAVGACGDSSDPATVGEPDTQNDSGTADAGDTADRSESTDESESADTSDQADVDSAANDPAEEDDARPADESTGDDANEAMSADPNLEVAISGWFLESNLYTSQQSESDCVAEGIVGGIGAERLAEVGVTVATPSPLGVDLTDAEGDIFIDTLFGCVDMRQSFIDNIVGPDLSEEDANCVVDEMGMDFILDGTRTGLLTPEDIDFDAYLEVVEAAGESCGVDME